jgi:hypothetical protein
MAQTVENMPPGPGERAKYPWGDWLNGEVWELVKGEDFTINPMTMMRSAHAKARYDGLKVKCSLRGDRLYVQARQPE